MTSSLAADRPTNLRRPRFRLIIADPDVAGSQQSPVKELDRYGVDVDVSANGGEVLLRAATSKPDAVVVSADGGELEGTAMVRLLTENVRVPVLAAIGTGEGGFAGPAVAAGAIGCVARPYLADELLPILRSIRPEAVADVAPPMRCGNLYLDGHRLEVSLGELPVRLPLKEFDLLRYFVKNADRVVTRDDIWTTVWGHRISYSSNTLTVHVKRLRGHLGDDQSEPRIILTIRGLGYRFVPPA